MVREPANLKIVCQHGRGGMGPVWRATVMRRRRLLPGWTKATNEWGYMGTGYSHGTPTCAAIVARLSFIDPDYHPTAALMGTPTRKGSPSYERVVFDFNDPRLLSGHPIAP